MWYIRFLHIFIALVIKSKLYHLKEFKTCHPQICYHGHLSWEHLKSSNCRERLSVYPLICLEIDPPKGAQLSTRGGSLLSQDRKLEVIPQVDRLCHQPLSAILSPSFLIYSPLFTYLLSSPSSSKIVYKLSDSNLFWGIYFFFHVKPPPLPQYIIFKMNILVYFFSC